jgi:3D (Asp-Asp-Asp) domain-containing protein
VRLRRDSRRLRPALATAVGAAALAAAAASGANPSSHDATGLRSANAALAARSRSAVLDLYSVDSRLTRANARLAALHAQQAALERQQQSVRMQQHVAAKALQVAQLQLAARLRALYERGDTDPIAVILGAESLDDAVATLDELNSSAAQDRDVIAQTLAARRTLHALQRKLARTQAQVSAAAAATATTAAELTGVRNARTALIASLARQRRLNAAEIGRLEAAARAAETKSAAINAQASTTAPVTSTPTPAPAPATGGQTLTVTATGYSLTGRTATGVPVGWGVVAVDPSVIPLGTHMTIPGYGAGVAADTGGAVQGATIDLWFPSQAQARAWGRRVVTITLR